MRKFRLVVRLRRDRIYMYLFWGNFTCSSVWWLWHRSYAISWRRVGSLV